MSLAPSPTKRSTLMNSEKYIGLDVHQATTSVRGERFQWQSRHGIHLGDEGLDHSRVPCGATRHFVGHLCRRNLGHHVQEQEHSAENDAAFVGDI